ncbi:MAG: thiol:disulfide interchange protein DsbE [Candidatus Tokpelaia sp. JSC189]|nr:MAG: thiol:disulfide interchange protein DsbE [Candidatus Tokpelaia sp. JSC189]
MTTNYLLPAKRWHMLFFLMPFALFSGFIIIAFIHISTPPQILDQLPNALTGKQIPDTVLPTLSSDNTTDPIFDMKNFKGRVTLINFWGSWCSSCREEHSFLMALANNPLFDLVSINYKDTEENGLRFLGTFGNPFRITGFDPSGRAAINWGIYGPPETFIVSKGNIILYRHIGPLTPAAFKKKLKPIITEARR